MAYQIEDNKIIYQMVIQCGRFIPIILVWGYKK